MRIRHGLTDSTAGMNMELKFCNWAWSTAICWHDNCDQLMAAHFRAGLQRWAGHTCIWMTASVWSRVVLARASKTKGYLQRVTTPSGPWGWRTEALTQWQFVDDLQSHQQHWPVGTSASGSTSHSHFWCLSAHPAHGCRIYRTGWSDLLSHSPEKKWQKMMKSSHLVLKKKKTGILCKVPHFVQDLQESQGSVQEAGEDPGLYRGNSNFMHLEKVHNHVLV